MPKPQKLLETYELWWWRHSSYEVRDGYLAPQADATLTIYDPWRDGGAAGFTSSLQEALNGLLELVPSKGRSAADDDSVVAWSCKYGPLGALPHRTNGMRLPRWPFDEPGLKGKNRQARRPGTEPPRNHRVSYPPGIRTPALIFHGGRFTTDFFAPASTDASTLPSSATVLRAKSFHEQQFLITPEWLREAWGQYFPDVPPDERETHRYPEPESREFAQAYREPIDEWWHWVAWLAIAIRNLDDVKDRLRWESGSAILSWLVQPITPVLRLDERNQACFAWRSPSLLAALAMVAMQRVATVGTSRICKDPECGGRFLPRNARMEYHSEHCRWRHSKATVRAKRRPKRSSKRSRTTKRERT
jgi:hypothetical protein